MRRKTGNLCMILGAALILVALSLFLLNRREAGEAQASAAAVLPQVVRQIEVRQEAKAELPEETPEDPSIPLELMEEEDLTMTEVEIDGQLYIGYLSIPALELELPILSDWDYTLLKIAPCRFSGTLRGEDLVLMAHNYTRHFGGISRLAAGDSVAFTDMDGNVTFYEVVGIDVLAPTAVEEMTAGDFDLTLFTCTYGGRSRVTVYCGRVE